MSDYCGLCGKKTRGLFGVCKGHRWKDEKWAVTPKEQSKNQRDRAKKVHNITCWNCKGKGCHRCHYIGKRLVRDGEDNK